METFAGIKLTPLTEKLLTRYCQETKEKPEDVIKRAVEQFLEKQEPTEDKQLDVEYETVTLRMPRKIMDFLRKTPEAHDPNAIKYLEYLVVDNIRAEVEATTGIEIMDWFGLKSVFYAILGDERFHP
ncbi:MAG: hypothetical protein ABSG57_08165 [Candidatus Bathyarchaeia archaeon]